MYLISAPTLDRYKRIEKLYFKVKKGNIGFGDSKCSSKALIDPELDPNLMSNVPLGQEKVTASAGFKNKFKRPWEHMSPWYKIGETDLSIPGKKKRN